MHAMQLLLRQPLRNGLATVRPSCQRSFVSSVPPKKLSLSAQSPASRQGSICLQCRFRTQTRKFSSPPRPEDKLSPSKPTPDLENLHATPDAGRDSISATVNNEEQQTTGSVRLEQKQDSKTLEEDTLPSDAERRRSQLSKKFTDLMDNIQGNVFIAGQKLNDLTGYSGIEKLKRDIETQGICHTFPCEDLSNPKQRMRSWKGALLFDKPKKHTQQLSTVAPPHNAKSMNSSKENTPGLPQTLNASHLFTVPTMPTKLPKPKRRSFSQKRNTS